MKNVVANKDQLLILLKENGVQIRGYGIKKIGVFGSFVRDEGITLKSDVDLIIEFKSDHDNLRNLFDLGFFLEDLLGRKVDLIPARALTNPSASYILNELEYVSLGPVQASAHARSNRKDPGVYARQNNVGSNSIF